MPRREYKSGRRDARGFPDLAKNMFKDGRDALEDRRRLGRILEERAGFEANNGF
jgi:hypothetical protein